MKLSRNPADYRHAGCMFWSVDDDNIPVFLLGQEHPEIGYRDQLKWSDFGGRPEISDEDVYISAAREGYEETAGFCGSYDEIYDKVTDMSTTIYNDVGVIVFGIPTRYDPLLPNLFDNVYNYTRQCMKVDSKGVPSIPSCRKKGLYEKIRIDWFTTYQIIENEDIMRPSFFKFFTEVMAKDFD